MGASVQYQNVEAKTTLGATYRSDQGLSGFAQQESTNIYYKGEGEFGLPSLGYGLEVSETKRSQDHPAFKEVTRTETIGLSQTTTTSNYEKTVVEEKGTIGISNSINAFLIGIGAEFKIEWNDVPASRPEVIEKNEFPTPTNFLRQPFE
jgi:hypothetical protein